jgi:hypothetical protein
VEENGPERDARAFGPDSAERASRLGAEVFVLESEPLLQRTDRLGRADAAQRPGRREAHPAGDVLERARERLHGPPRPQAPERAGRGRAHRSVGVGLEGGGERSEGALARHPRERPERGRPHARLAVPERRGVQGEYRALVSQHSERVRRGDPDPAAPVVEKAGDERVAHLVLRAGGRRKARRERAGVDPHERVLIHEGAQDNIKRPPLAQDRERPHRRAADPGVVGAVGVGERLRRAGRARRGERVCGLECGRDFALLDRAPEVAREVALATLCGERERRAHAHEKERSERRRNCGLGHAKSHGQPLVNMPRLQSRLRLLNEPLDEPVVLLSWRRLDAA